jgi:RNA polymerase primary sigma factor
MRWTIALLAALVLVGMLNPPPPPTHVAGHSERLAARARRGDRVARAKLVEKHMGLVRSIAFRYRNLGMPVDDLVQEGAIGLLAAIDDYDARRGASFSTYAFWRTRAAVTHALTGQGRLLRVPRPVLERHRQVVRTREWMAASGREPSTNELAQAASLQPAEVAAAMTPASVASLDEATDFGATLHELVSADAATSPEAHFVSSEETRVVRRAVRRLHGRKQTIVNRHFGFAGNPESLAEIADDLHLSPERTRAIKDEALRELAVELEPALGA